MKKKIHSFLQIKRDKVRPKLAILPPLEFFLSLSVQKAMNLLIISEHDVVEENPRYVPVEHYGYLRKTKTGKLFNSSPIHGFSYPSCIIPTLENRINI
ncbi:LOW QUALITY PROTEIN: hypothetical protein PanWU01x14_098040 [Parasponia andersonii]|uniref:Uncharacterized protein n=1 Tax=Parasponia andersonii TaxID=3476 RepID=A0A2P5D4L3_PARAD|nr:LOW QUALITY PROTEIN: hypothetical protein PanWU01x14_098040 [Parasponia andersonii]